MNHEISGGNFHGEYRITLRGPAEGFRLSKSQERKVDRKLCGISDCKCGGGYGRGADEDSALLEGDYDRTFLIPLSEIQNRRVAAERDHEADMEYEAAEGRRLLCESSL